MLAVALVLFLTPATGWADDQVKSRDIQIQLQLNSEHSTINGEDVIIEKPYLSDDTTLVPLRVITAAFGALIDWDSASQKITIKYGGHTIVLAIGSKMAEVDVNNLELPASPQLMNGTTMVPIRFISETVGAKVSFDETTSVIAISGTKQVDAVANSLNADEGKTRIGNSYYKWSIDYPSGLVKKSGSFQEDKVGFLNAQHEYTLDIFVEDSDHKLSEDEILQRTYAHLNAYKVTVLEQKIVTNDKDNGYAHIAAKVANTVYDLRGYQDNNRFYCVSMTMIFGNKEDYKNSANYQSYMNLLNSFKTSYDTNDSAIKDLSTYKDGYRTFTITQLGFSLKVPVDWTQITDMNSLAAFKNDTTKSAINIHITSVAEGDTLAAWVNRKVDDIRSTFAQDYVKISPPINTEVANLPAKLLSYSTKTSGSWTNYNAVYFFNDKYKSEFDYIQANTDIDARQFNDMLKTISFDASKVDPALEKYIMASKDLDKSKRTTVTPKKNHYSIDIPNYWSKSNDSAINRLAYSFTQGSFTVLTIEDGNFDNRVKEEEWKLNIDSQTSKEFKLVQKDKTQIDGVQANRYVYIDGFGEDLNQTAIYIFQKDSYVFEITVSNSLSTSTEENQKRIDDTVQSFQFTD